MRTHLIFFVIAVLSLTISPISLTSNAASTKLEILAITDTKPGEVEVTFNTKIAKSLITSYQITAKSKTATGASFSKSYKSKVSGVFTHKISKLTPNVEYIFTIRVTTKSRQVITSAGFNYLISSTIPTAPLITKAVATDADEAVVFFTAPKDDGGTPIYYYTATSNPGAISVIAPIQGSGSVTITGLTKATTYTFTLTAHNINGSSRAATSPAPITTLAEKIVRSSPSSTTNAPTLAAPAFTLSSSSQSVIVNNAITTVTNTSTGGAISSYAISPAVPAGLTFSTTTGQLSGTPTSTQSATAYTITATNAAGSATATFTLTVSSAAPAFSLSSVAETRVATTAITAYTITSTGAPITSYSVVGTLPTGLSFDTSTGRITGTPTETRTATTYTIIGASASGETATATYRLRVTGDIGDTGPGGGRIFYYLAAGFNCGPTSAATCKYLEAAPNGWSGGADPTVSWAQASPVNLQSNILANNLTLPSPIGYGAQNTKAIIDQGNTNSSTSAAARANSYSSTISGFNYNDWFLPSEAELSQLFIQRVAVGMEFSGASYWSSTSQGNQNGRYLIVTHVSATPGSFSGWTKDAAFNVRPIRAF